jgi:hypothetical protein
MVDHARSISRKSDRGLFSSDVALTG